MPGPWFSYGKPHSYGRPSSYGAPASYGRAAGAGDPGPTSGDPLLVEALASTRDALLAGLSLEALASLAIGATQRWASAGDGLPPLGKPELLHAQGDDVRAALVQFEVLGSFSFAAASTPSEWVTLSAGSTVIVRARRPPREHFLAELDRVQAQAPLRATRAAEIITQVTPPHAYFAAVLGLQSGRHPRTLELVLATLAAAYAVGQRFKLALAAPRPTEYSSQIQPMIEVPQHCSFPAGHAVEAHITARILSALTAASPQQRKLLRALADRVAENRVVAGVHFPVDCRFGRLIGDSLGSYLLSACGVRESADAAWQGGSFDGGLSTGDFAPSAAPFSDNQTGAQASPSPAVLPLYAQLWARAAAEWPAPSPAVPASAA